MNIPKQFVGSILCLLIGPLAAGSAMANEVPRTVTVNGTATVYAKPDIARISMSVVERNPSLETAQANAAAVTNRVLKLLDGLGVDRDDVDTTGISVQPDYRWDRKTEQQELLGYIAQRSIQVQLKDLDKLGELMEGAVGTGVNQVSPPSLDRSKRRAANRRALADAAADARENAQTLATALGAKLGRVISIQSGGQAAPPRPMMAMRADAMAESSAESYNAGAISFDADVTVVFALEGN